AAPRGQPAPDALLRQRNRSGDLSRRARASARSVSYQDMRVAVPRVGDEAERRPERRAAGTGIDRHRTTRRSRSFEQRRGEPAADTPAAEPLSNIEPTHPQGLGNGWVDRQAPDRRELVID